MNSWERNKYDRTVNSGTGLFSPCGKFSEIRTGWAELFSIADTTQQLYLGLPGWHELEKGGLNKKRDIKKSASSRAGKGNESLILICLHAFFLG